MDCAIQEINSGLSGECCCWDHQGVKGGVGRGVGLGLAAPGFHLALPD